MGGMRRAVVTGSAVAVAAVAVAAWVRWLASRQHHWKGALAEAIPVNSAYWRAQKARPGELLYAAIGDSAAQGIGASRPAHSYVGVIARQVRERTTMTVRVANLVADLPSFYFLPGERRVRVANGILRAAAQRHGLRVVDLWAATRRQGLWGVTTQFAGDLFHPNDRGYRLWASVFQPAVGRRVTEIAAAPPSSME